VLKTVVLVTLLAAPQTFAAARVQAGQWETKLTIGSSKPMRTEYCITPQEAALMNGDLATLRKYLEQSTREKTAGRCAIRDVAIKGNQTIVTIACGKSVVVGTTTYHGDRYESSSSDGSSVMGKRVGDCP
jgi:hypothetical protein